MFYDITNLAGLDDQVFTPRNRKFATLRTGTLVLTGLDPLLGCRLAKLN